jgi:hypothetical protein
MNTKSISAPPPQDAWHRPVLFIFGVIFLLILLWLLFLHPSLSHSQCSLVRIILALAAAGIGAIIPGTISTNAPGIAKAGGAAAFFVLVLIFFDCPTSPIASGNDNTLPIVNPVERPKEPELPWHTEDKDGVPYKIVWRMDPACKNTARLDGTHHCDFSRPHVHIGASNDPFDHWNISVDAPGPVHDVQCKKGDHQLYQDKTDTNTIGEIEGKTGRCQGWINGGDDEVTITAPYKERW